ncbi:UDP-galactose transporter 1 [Hondaea fermentalgiana]|uniref:UDP-galactose transporter 1 n=1 Tax=Hondaea fermentalgiana TaxID=2315210 RepID=A0A2R5GJC2_9STRA|nr:UDP-galactose transporter 1 [Hondaea fermentalgiana]|eukprot:GBG30715.1 UDP-galactose transporter 1 [Hondaea fermentalgiana]
MLEESHEHADLIVQTVPSGYRNFLSRFFFQMEWILERYDADYILRLDDDGFLCVEQLFSLLEVFPRERFFYGKYFCAREKRVADENIMLFSQDVVKNLTLMRPLLRVNAGATFAAHFGMWQHFLDVDVFDDQMRIDSQVNGPRTKYMHTKPTPGEEFIYAANSTYGEFCDKFVWAHHVPDPLVIRRGPGAAAGLGVFDGGKRAKPDVQSSGLRQRQRSGSNAKTKYSLVTMGLLSAVFLFSGPMLIMSNKFILRTLEFEFPLTLTLMTLVFCSIVTWIFVHARGTKLRHEQMITREFYMYRICPIGVLSAGTIVLGMTSYLFLTVAFVQMLKAFTPVMTLGGLVLFRLTNPSRKVVASVLVICIGTAIAGAGELNFSIVGMACMLLAQTCEALKLIYTQVVLQNLRFDLAETLYYITPTSAVFVFFFALFLEFPYMTADHWAIVFEHQQSFFMSCICAIATNVINTFVIQFSNALVLKLVATARNAVLVLVNAMFFGEIVTTQQYVGYFVSLGGFVAYNYINYKDAQQRKQQASSSK